MKLQLFLGLVAFALVVLALGGWVVQAFRVPRGKIARRPHVQ